MVRPLLPLNRCGDDTITAPPFRVVESSIGAGHRFTDICQQHGSRPRPMRDRVRDRQNWQAGSKVEGVLDPACRKQSRDQRRIPYGARRRSTIAFLTLLSRREGAAIPEMMEVSGWQQHSVRGFLAGTVKKKLGFTLTSSKTVGRCVATASKTEAQVADVKNASLDIAAELARLEAADSTSSCGANGGGCMQCSHRRASPATLLLRGIA